MRKLLIICFPVLALTSCHRDVEPDNRPNLRPLSGAEQALSTSDNNFAFSLFRNVRSGQAENVFISPLSVGLALGMTVNGAAGDTRDGILNAIDFGGLEPVEVNQGYHDLTSLLLSMDRKVELRIANSVWYRNIYTINPEFSSIVKESYDAKAAGLDFSNPSARDEINGWVEEKTDNKIQNLIEEISSDKVMFLINAIYFKGDWVNQFDKSQTKKEGFNREDGSIDQVDMMYSKGVTLSIFEDSNLTLFDIPYGNGQFTMTILRPQPGHTVSGIVEGLSSDSLNAWLAQSDTITPILEMPKFKMKWKQDLSSPLSTMGMSVAFTDNANFPGLLENSPPLQISAVIHQSFVEVNEEGSIAAAATAVGVGTTSALPSPMHLRIDRPFVFMIREKHSGVILFIGQLHHPEY